MFVGPRCEIGTTTIILSSMNTPTDHPSGERAAIDHAFLKNVRRMGTVEGVSTLVLFGVAMPLKYMADMPLAVRIAGSVHGFLFIGLAVMLMMAITRIPISRSMALAGIVAAVVPFGPFVYDRWLAQKAAA
jgi:integral membrane protein